MRLSGGLGYYCGLVIACSCLFVVVYGSVHSEEDEWIDPFDMLNYDPTTKTMRKPVEVKV